MTDTIRQAGSVVERTRPVAAPGPVVAVHFIGDAAAFALGEEALLLVSPRAERRAAVHDGGILAVAGDGRRIVTGGDDGRLAETDADGATTILATDAKGRWIDRVAIGPDGATAWSAGKTAFVRTGRGDQRSFDLPSSIGGLAFAPKGFRLAIAHYHGVSLWFPNASSVPETLEWKGSHLGVTWSRDAKFVVTAMQEPALHAWRLADRRDMRMSGYASKVRSMGWTAGGDRLATSGADQLILWPFQGKDGPIGRAPDRLAATDANVSIVACHPARDVVAVGFTHGLVLLVRIGDGGEVIAKRPGGAAVTALAWSAGGNLLAFGTEEGEAGVVDLS